MNRSAQRKAQERVDRIPGFRAELAELEREGGLALTTEQRSQLDAHLQGVLSTLARQFGADVGEVAKRISWGMRLATFLGAVAIGAATVLFLHRIWGVLPSVVHMPLLALVPLLALGAAEFSFRRGVALYYTALLAFAAGTGFAMELSALGGTLNTVPSAQALLVWAAFALALAYAYGLRLLLASGLVLACGYAASLWTAFGGSYWLDFLDQPATLIPAAGVVYVVPWLSRRPDSHDFGLVYRLCGAALLLIALLGLSKRGDLCCAGLPGRAQEAVYQVVGLGLSAGVIVHGLRLGRGSLVNLGAVAFVVFLFVRLQAWWWDWMPKYLFFLLIGLIAMLLLVPFRQMRKRLVGGAGL